MLHARIRVARAVLLIDPAAHLARTAEHVADEAHPARSVRQTSAADRDVTRGIRKRDPEHRTAESMPGKVVAEEGVVDARASGGIRIGVERVVPLEQHLVRPDHMGSVDAGFHPLWDGQDHAVVHVVVADDRARPQERATMTLSTLRQILFSMGVSVVPSERLIAYHRRVPAKRRRGRRSRE